MHGQEGRQSTLPAGLSRLSRSQVNHPNNPSSLNMADLVDSLAMVEMRVILAKMLWVYDMELTDDKLDWVRDSPAWTLWYKPALPVRFTRRAGVVVPAFG
jgi:hypothetical protein